MSTTKIYSRYDYMNFFREISFKIIQNSFHENIQIHPKYGSGSIDIYNINSNVSMIATDIIYYKLTEIDYSMPSGFLEMNACFNGMIHNKTKKYGERTLHNKELSIYVAAQNDYVNEGTLCFPTNTPIRSFCFAMDGNFTSHFFSNGQYPFEENQATSIKLQHRAPELSFILQQMKNQQIAEPFLPIYMEGKMMEAMAILSSAMLQKSEANTTAQDIVQIHKIPQILKDNIQNPPTIEALSKSLAINRQKLQLLFQKEFGETLYTYHKRIRLNHSKLLLTDTTQTVESISFDVGYANPSYFCSAFKSEMGITPSEYRKNQRNL